MLIIKLIFFQKQNQRWFQIIFRLNNFAADCNTHQQDNARAHRVELLRREMRDFIASDLRPSNNPNLSSVDYRIWQCFRSGSISSLCEMSMTWSNVSLSWSLIDEAIDQWRVRHSGDRRILVHGQVTIIFVVSVCLFVCLSVCLFVCAEFLSAVFDPIWIKLGHMLHVRV